MGGLGGGLEMIKNILLCLLILGELMLLSSFKQPTVDSVGDEWLFIAFTMNLQPAAGYGLPPVDLQPAISTQ